MSDSRLARISGLVWALAVANGTAAIGQPSFQGTGNLTPGPTGYGIADGVSGNGLVVVGTSNAQTPVAHSEGFLWSAAGGILGIGLPANGLASTAECASFSGSVIAGAASVGPTSLEALPCRWTAGSGFQFLTPLPANAWYGTVRDMSDDGATLVGWVTLQNNGAWPFIWKEGSGFVPFPAAPPGFSPSTVSGVSGDGAVIVGNGWRLPAGGQAGFYWSQATGMIVVTDPTGNISQPIIWGVSADGSVAVGAGDVPGGKRSFLWTVQHGIEVIGSANCSAQRVSADGSVVIGVQYTPAYGPFLWDRMRGYRMLASVLVNEYGMNIGTWNLNFPTGISHDGRTIVGWGFGPSSENNQGWVARLLAPGAFAIAAPAADARGVSVTPTLQWTPSAGQMGYTIVVANDAALTSVVFQLAGLPAQSLAVPPGMLLPAHRYYWSVTTANPSGVTAASPAPASFVTIVYGDTDGDSDVDFVDLNVTLASYGQSGASLPADFNGDGVVNFLDLNVLLANYGVVVP